MSEKETKIEKDGEDKQTDDNSTEPKSDDDSPRGTKRSAPDSTDDLKVSSANDWEHADLGDTERKNKFLRLMGASKKEHHGKFIIGDQERASERAAEKTVDVTQELENQYEQGIAHRLQGGRRGHIGLGFQEPEKDEDASNDERTVSSSDKAASVEGSTNSPQQSEEDKDSKQNPLPDSSMQQATAQKYTTLGFVKGSTTS